MTAPPIVDGLSYSSILELAENARRATLAQATAFVIDYGGGAPTLTFEEPSEQICGALTRTGGGYEQLYTAESVEKMIIHVTRAASVTLLSELARLRAIVASVDAWRREENEKLSRRAREAGEAVYTGEVR